MANNRPRWRNIKYQEPKYNRAQDSHGVPVLVVDGDEVKQAYYGVRVTDEPSFYLHGAVLHNVVNWMPLPEAPGKNPAIETSPTPWRVGRKQARNIYDANDEEIGVFFTEHNSILAVASVNAIEEISKLMHEPPSLEVREKIRNILDGV